MSDAETKTSVQRRVNSRLAWLHKGIGPREAIGPNIKLALVALIEEGATLVEIARMEGMPSVGTVYNAMKNDPQFATDMDAARGASATTVIEEAQHELREALESGDTDRMSMAVGYHRGSLEYAAKIAPREYGQLLKIAGADGGALTVNVVNYGTGSPLIDVEASREVSQLVRAQLGNEDAQGTEASSVATCAT